MLPYRSLEADELKLNIGCRFKITNWREEPQFILSYSIKFTALSYKVVFECSHNLILAQTILRSQDWCGAIDTGKGCTDVFVAEVVMDVC